jgi:putative ABC transport system permease protein
VKDLLLSQRRRPAPLIGTFVGLALAGMLVTVITCLIGTSVTMTVPAQRLAAASVVVTGNQNVHVTSGQGQNASTDVLALPAYRRLPAGLATQLAKVPGVAAAVPDVSVPLALRVPDGRVLTGSATDPLTGYGWQSAPLTPFTVVSGHAPADSRDIVIGAGLAQAAGLRPGDAVRLAGQDLPSFTVTGVAASPAGDPAQDWSVFFTSAEATALYGHPGQSDLIGLTAKPGTPAATLAARVQAAVAGRGLTVLSGASIGQAEYLTLPTAKENLWQLGISAGVDLMLIVLFVVAGTVALSVNQRQRSFALLLAVGATPGQVRRMLMAELAVLGAAAAAVGYLPGIGLATWAVAGMAAHQLLPPSTQTWISPLPLLIAAGAGIVMAELAGYFAIRRASRLTPVTALQQADNEQRWPRLPRLIFGVCALGGGTGLFAATLSSSTPVEEIQLALLTALMFMIAVALFGPLLVAAAESLLRLPARLLGGVAARLALADIRVRPRRMSSAVVPVALAVTFIGMVYLANATESNAAAVQGTQRLAASAALSVPGPGLDPAALAAVKDQPGVADAVALTPATVFVPYSGSDNAAGEAVTGGPLSAVLDLKVISGSLSGFGPGDIALSRLESGRDAVDASVGQTITAYLPDGTPYRAKVTAIYDRSLGFGDVIIPASAAGGGHLGTPALGQILVRASAGTTTATLARQLDPLSSRFPGLTVAERSAVLNAQAQLNAAQNTYTNNLLLVIIAILAAVSLVNTLAMATAGRRDSLRLLIRVGATTRQLLSMTGWQTLTLSVTGIGLGISTGAASVLVITKVLTGSWAPYVPAVFVVIMVAAVLALTALSVFTPTSRILAEPGDD